jgi:hypothetical protein
MIYVTKYALTEGIRYYADGKTEDRQLVCVRDPRGYNGRCYFGASHWTDDLAIAKARAEKMRQTKLVSLRKQIARLEALEF